MTEATPAQNRAVAQSFVALGLTLIVMGVLLFAPAGTFAWPLAWWFVAAFAVCTLIAVGFIWRVNPEMFVARSRIQPGTKATDYFFIALVVGGFMAVLPVAGLDFRFGWSRAPGWVIGLGFILFVLGYAGSIWPVAVNRHFEPGIRIQQDRGHKVIDTGPYAIIRHPGYSAANFLILGIALMLGSYWALVPVVVAVVGSMFRTVFEEQTLRAELSGYTDYTRRVRWRWVPGVW